MAAEAVAGTDEPHAIDAFAGTSVVESVVALVAPVGVTAPPKLTKRILVVDDDLALRDLVSELLTARNYDVITAESGYTAIRACEATRFNLILLDVQMPRMDGMEAAQTIRKQGALNASTPIMAVTGYLSLDRVAQLHAAGMNDYLPKPLKLDVFFARVAHWCG